MKLLLYLPQILLTLVAIYIIARCFAALFSMRPAGRPKAVLINKANGKKLAISTYETSLGRAKNCDIQLASNLASRAHAVISRRKKGWFITDTGSKTGTYVNGEAIESATRIFQDDEISIGGVEYIFIAPHASREEAQGRQRGTGSAVTLLNSATGYEYPIENGKLTIGRDEENDVIIDDRRVSRFHASIVHTDSGWIVRDNDSTAGVGLNGYRVHGTEFLANGDKIFINTHQFVFKDASQKSARGRGRSNG